MCYYFHPYGEAWPFNPPPPPTPTPTPPPTPHPLAEEHNQHYFMQNVILKIPQENSPLNVWISFPNNLNWEKIQFSPFVCEYIQVAMGQIASNVLLQIWSFNYSHVPLHDNEPSHAPCATVSGKDTLDIDAGRFHFQSNDGKLDSVFEI